MKRKIRNAKLGAHQARRGRVARRIADSDRPRVTAIAKLAQKHDIREVVFHRNGFLYHGRVKALAEAAREAGLQF
jgi:Ribosomal L18 of archaea, bacteria, mitoch. and chloroplast